MPHTETEIKSYISSNQKSSYLNSKEELDFSKKAPETASKRHNLRRKVTKEGCDKTPISSTKLNENGPTDSNGAPFNKTKRKKRNTEKDNLYEYLQTINWAKNFSPENILTQTTKRQAAISSAFGQKKKKIKKHNPRGFHDFKLQASIEKKILETTEEESECDEKMPPSPSLHGHSSDYKAIKVNRHHAYIQVMLLVNKRKSIFLTLEVLKELRDLLVQSKKDSNCSVVVINGVEGSFCSGLDIEPLVGPQKISASKALIDAVQKFIEELSRFTKVLVAVVNGPAIGLGMTLLHHVDIILASDKATFCMPYPELGYFPEGGAAVTLPQVVGATVAKDLIISSRTMTAQEALNIGLISEVHEARLLPNKLIYRLQSLTEKPLSVLEPAKSLVKMQLHTNLQVQLQAEVLILPSVWLRKACQDSLQKALDSGIFSK